MNGPGSLVWFARHELRLAWRDALSMMTGGRKGRERKVAIGALVFLAFLHLVAYLALAHAGRSALQNDMPTFVAVTAGIVLAGSAMLSQAMESVTRTFYSRSDLELILSSPAPANRLFAVRLGAIALSVGAMSLFLMGPFIDVLAFEGGVHWLGAYGVIAAVSCVATALGAMLTVLLFHAIGPKRTRLAAQIVAAVIGGVFVIGLQFAAMFSTGTASRAAFLKSRFVLDHAPGMASIVWWPARAALGDGVALAALMLVSFGLLLVTALLHAPRFGAYAIAAAGISERSARAPGSARAFRIRAAAAALRHKERLLLLRDPWLLSQSLMQLLYLLPPAALLWRSFASDGRTGLILVPVLIMAAGQLAGGLAWLTISGEDAPDLVRTAPVPEALIWRAKIEAVMECVGVVFAPFCFGLLFLSPGLALIAASGVTASAASAAAIQFWFRSQAKRSQFRRRHTASRIATFSEAFSSITWAAAGAVAAAGSWFAIVVALIAIAILASVRSMSPARAQAKLV
jgi:ABC-2 type transport system permease protein